MILILSESKRDLFCYWNYLLYDYMKLYIIIWILFDPWNWYIDWKFNDGYISS